MVSKDEITDKETIDIAFVPDSDTDSGLSTDSGEDVGDDTALPGSYYEHVKITYNISK